MKKITPKYNIGDYFMVNNTKSGFFKLERYGYIDKIEYYLVASNGLGLYWSEEEVEQYFRKVNYMNTPLYQLLNGENNE